ncbi:ABC transporter ATP-binding protein [Streptomyces albireticuli]|uniref:ABC transporter ATP-binding protein n=1 Tax=Streptomyces albireticuli TaxID=1940 RepID=A0A2A2D152_9ACTN|nr:ABC transporter ATP-binding protein [Streptomyces albireticuli]MCD9145740.1 ATP-binding cassette domain-containing protein [Streptomyces albireticuli]MCD9165528.1 ATP-binding cassette domain-containing protein [Streptomyces albireticuli]MCD9195949.1 ATP-binding cassette domain-containing protein [Streptomyces albireticuli]PAU45187.1 ABC transporter ATP-binding protein [Streptomyces albireticuli]
MTAPAAPAAPAGTAAHPEPGRPRSGHRALLEHLRPQRGRLTAGVVTGLVGSVLGLAQPLAAERVVDDLGHGRPAAGPVVVLSLLVAAGAVLVGLGHYLLQCSAESLVRTARCRLTDRILRLRVCVVERAEPGDLIARVTSDTTLLRQTTPLMVAAAVTGTLVTVATVVLMGLLDAVLLGVTLTVVALVAVLVAVVAPRIGRATRGTQEAVGRMGAALERALGAFRTVKASGAERQETAALHRAAEEARRAGVRAAAWEAVSATASAVVVQVSFLVVLGVGGARVASGDIRVSTLVAFLLYLFALAPRISQMAEGVGQLQMAAAAAGRIGDVEELAAERTDRVREEDGTEEVREEDGTDRVREEDGTEEVREEDGTDRVREEDGAEEVREEDGSDGVREEDGSAAGGPLGVAFDRVCFGYRPGTPRVHHEVTFTVPARGLTAFVGPSGAGKTTVFSLLERFYEPDSGRVLLDGRDIRQWPLALLRARIGYVEQDAPVLAGTLRDNLTLGAADPSAGDLARALSLTRLDAVADRLPHGLDTDVGHRGSRLSGGERQRVALARALLRRPRLLLLDEATSQLDAANEAALRETIADLARDTTVLVVAHRLSTVTSADRIVVMEAGRVRAVGTHAELLARDALYRRLARTQSLDR